MKHGFTLVEVLIATTVLAVVMTIVFVSNFSVLKRAKHTEGLITGVQQLRYASDLISQAVRSASRTPVVQSGGLELVVAPEDLGFAVTNDIAPIDALHNVYGTKANMRNLKVSNITPAAAASSIFVSSARPPGALTSVDVSTYFKSASDLGEIDLNDVFKVGDMIAIPGTRYGSPVTGIINSISNNPGTKTITLVNNVGVDIPAGTKIRASAGRRLLFSVTTTGDLRYYPDSRDLTKFSVIATDIDPSPRSAPAVSSSPDTVPFTLTGRYVTLNLQKLPRGTMAGRTVQGVQTTVFARSDPLIP